MMMPTFLQKRVITEKGVEGPWIFPQTDFVLSDVATEAGAPDITLRDLGQIKGYYPNIFNVDELVDEINETSLFWSVYEGHGRE